VWKDFKTRFQNILDRLRRHREVIGSQANLLHFQQYQLDRTKMLEGLRRSENERRQKNYKEALEWISGADTNLDHESACAARSEYPGSGRWILKHSKLQNWKEAGEPVSSILWLNGIPGAGGLRKISNRGPSDLTLFRQNYSSLGYHRKLFRRCFVQDQFLLLQTR
jgi:hypothetical protein